MLLDCGWLNAPDAPYGGPCRGEVRVVSGDMRIASDGDSVWIGRDEGPAYGNGDVALEPAKAALLAPADTQRAP